MPSVDSEDVVKLLKQAARNPHAAEECVAKILDAGQAAVPGLLSVLRAEADAADAPYTEQRQAAYLLVELIGAEAVEPLLDALMIVPPDFNYEIYDAALLLRPLAGERALARLERRIGHDDNHHQLYWMLANSGYRSDRALETLIGYFDRDPGLGAVSLRDYGDPQASSVLLSYLEALGEPDPRRLYDCEQVFEAYEALAGDVDPALRHRLEPWFRLGEERKRKRREEFEALKSKDIPADPLPLRSDLWLWRPRAGR
jgi:hypothetical protein